MLRSLCDAVLHSPTGMQWMAHMWQSAVNVTVTADALQRQCSLVPAHVDVVIGVHRALDASFARSCDDCVGLVCPDVRAYVNREVYSRMSLGNAQQ